MNAPFLPPFYLNLDPIKSGSKRTDTSHLINLEEELTIHYSLKKMLIRGWLKNEYGFDPTTPLSPVLVNQYLDQLEPIETPLKLLFRNELGLLLFHHYQIEQTIPC